MRKLGWIKAMLGIMLGVMLGAVHGTAWAADCEWKPPKEPPTFSLVAWRGAELSFSADPKWFNCAKKAGGELAAQFIVSGENEKRIVPARRPITSFSAREMLSLKDICAQGPGPKTVQVTLVGKGQLARLDFTSEPAQHYCPRCELGRGIESFVLHTDQAMTPKGMYTFEATVNESWHKCAREGSTLELWLYAAPTRLEAEQLKEPTHKIAGLEHSPRIKKSFARTPICEGGVQWLGYELRGTGELQLAHEGRGVIEARCTR
ncbi:hypothetical protein [Hyalangium rubrum]|uniref:Lipoprotein n=1 Tax=Hyalangium rubrum TaxID=3103134 RepID=A0ABU5HG81_9BACT|nr:hypothetical protein [Hyalangium sp. s54d21]MDY7232275.1 hypothetical protein [Hyalangium sp. s54d21]